MPPNGGTPAPLRGSAVALRAMARLAAVRSSKGLKTCVCRRRQRRLVGLGSCETNRIGLEAKTKVNLLMMNPMQHRAEEKRIRFVWRESDITAFLVGGAAASFSVRQFQCHSDGSRLDTFQASSPTNGHDG